jgi:hypothetical protein
VTPASTVVSDVHDERRHPIDGDRIAGLEGVSSFEFEPEVEKFISLMFGEKSKETLGRSKLLLWLFVQSRLCREREGVARVDLYDVVNEKKADYFIDIDRPVHVVQKNVSYKAEVPAMFRAVFPSVFVSFYSCEPVHPLKFVQFANEGELSFEVLHERDGRGGGSLKQDDSRAAFRLVIFSIRISEDSLPRRRRYVRKEPPLTVA